MQTWRITWSLSPRSCRWSGKDWTITARIGDMSTRRWYCWSIWSRLAVKRWEERRRRLRKVCFSSKLFLRLPSNAKKTFSRSRLWRISSLLRTTRTRDSTWGRKPRPWWLSWRMTRGWRTKGRELWRRRKDLLSPPRVRDYRALVLPGSHKMFAGYHPEHQGSPVGSPGDEYQQRLKPDIELAR